MTEIFNEKVGYIFKGNDKDKREYRTKYMLSDKKIEELKKDQLNMKLNRQKDRYSFLMVKRLLLISMDMQTYQKMNQQVTNLSKVIMINY